MGGDAQHRKISRTSWTNLCRFKFYSGLGFEDFQKLNLACLAKQSWSLMIDTSILQVKVIKELYFSK